MLIAIPALLAVAFAALWTYVELRPHGKAGDLLPWMHGPYICFPLVWWTNDALMFVAIHIGERLYRGCYCFHVGDGARP